MTTVAAVQWNGIEAFFCNDSLDSTSFHRGYEIMIALRLDYGNPDASIPAAGFAIFDVPPQPAPELVFGLRRHFRLKPPIRAR